MPGKTRLARTMSKRIQPQRRPSPREAPESNERGRAGDHVESSLRSQRSVEHHLSHQYGRPLDRSRKGSATDKEPEKAYIEPIVNLSTAERSHTVPPGRPVRSSSKLPQEPSHIVAQASRPSARGPEQLLSSFQTMCRLPLVRQLHV